MAYNFNNIYKNLRAPLAYNLGNKYTTASGPGGVMTGQEITDNFGTLADAALDLHNRVKIIEGWPLSAESSQLGYIGYTGKAEGAGYFYGGVPLSIPGVSTLSFPFNITTEEYFSISAGKGITYTTNGSVDQENSIFYEINSGIGNFSTMSSLLSQLNAQLINNGSPSGFSFLGTVDLTSISDWTTRFSWGTTPASFYVYVDDDPNGVLVTLNTTVNPPGGATPEGLTGLTTVLNIALSSAGLFYDITAEIASGIYMKFSGNNTRPAGCSRLKIEKNVDSASDILYNLGLLGASETSKTIFDFSTTLQFRENPSSANSIELIGVNSYEKLLIKDNIKNLTTPSLLNHLNIPISPSEASLKYHTDPPKLSQTTVLNYGGILKVSRIFSADISRFTLSVINGSTFAIPAGYKINYIFVKRTGGNTNTTFKITVGGIDISSLLTLSSNTIFYSLPCTITYFPSNSTATTVLASGGGGESAFIMVELQYIG